MKIVVVAQMETGEEIGRSEIEVLPGALVIMSPLDMNDAIQMINQAAREALARFAADEGSGK